MRVVSDVGAGDREAEFPAEPTFCVFAPAAPVNVGRRPPARPRRVPLTGRPRSGVRARQALNISGVHSGGVGLLRSNNCLLEVATSKNQADIRYRKIIVSR